MHVIFPYIHKSNSFVRFVGPPKIANLLVQPDFTRRLLSRRMSILFLDTAEL